MTINKQLEKETPMSESIMKVAVLMGGWNDERAVSLSSGREVVKVLTERGYDVQTIEVQRPVQDLIAQLAPKPDVAFICTMHGKWFEDGCLQGLLELLQIPYTNSGPLASAIAMNKAMSRTVFQAAGIPVAEGGVYHRQQFEQGHVMMPPYVVKPICEGSSLGVKLIRDDSDLTQMDATWKYGEQVVAERYIPGREIQVLIMGNQAIGTVEIRSPYDVCDYEAKYTPGKSERLVPAPIHPTAHQQALAIALRAHQALGCEGVSRVDLRYDDTAGEPGQFYVLEINTQPGMTPTSFAPLIAGGAGISFGDLVEWMVKNPRCPQ
jgi:D-alanine-D-alanine ligase